MFLSLVSLTILYLLVENTAEPTFMRDATALKEVDYASPFV